MAVPLLPGILIAGFFRCAWGISVSLLVSCLFRLFLLSVWEGAILISGLIPVSKKVGTVFIIRTGVAVVIGIIVGHCRQVWYREDVLRSEAYAGQNAGN